MNHGPLGRQEKGASYPGLEITAKLATVLEVAARAGTRKRGWRWSYMGFACFRRRVEWWLRCWFTVSD